ncbi:uncharacterized protein LOC117667561 isoform X2 [Pantherophis guttatus]|uniref:Uncharacterized protein LOC117667561 isoform X2 n=1 Tax=Pantherophis guttatus TaxID=94885 RepID=A0A6P9CC43_PANGU|nr:uncharacterized protein LOC117667561 isoform X2 [Pantherophis guttatus]
MADKKLEEVRAEFIKRVNKSIINQLLDVLLHKRIIDDEEVEEVNAKDKTQDQARILIDNTKTVMANLLDSACQKFRKTLT